jgi:hypothetical protein
MTEEGKLWRSPKGASKTITNRPAGNLLGPTATARPERVDVRFIITTLGRTDVITKCVLKLMLPAHTLIVPSEGEAEAYAKVCDGWTIQPYPDRLNGHVGAIREWVCSTVPDRYLMFLDDDVELFGCQVGFRGRPITNPERIHAIVCNTARMAEEAGTVLYGFAHTFDVRRFRCQRPFAFSGYINGYAMGVIGREIEFDRRFDTKCDIDYALQVLLRKRILWRDSRFAFWGKAFRVQGGLAPYRTMARMQQSIDLLKQKWGNAVEVSHDRGKWAAGVHINVSR